MKPRPRASALVNDLLPNVRVEQLKNPLLLLDLTELSFSEVQSKYTFVNPALRT